MKRFLRGSLETVAGIGIFVALIAAYNWMAPWKPDSWSSIQTSIGVGIWAIGLIAGALVGAGWFAWKALGAIVRRFRSAAE